MKKIILLMLSLLLLGCQSQIYPIIEENEKMEVTQSNDYLLCTYRGTKGYGTISKEDVLKEDAKVYTFEFADGEVKDYAILNDETYSIQNQLMKDHHYYIKEENDQIIEIQLHEEDSALPFYKAVPGKRTLLNLIQTAFEPVGKVLYVYGGGWNFQDTGGSRQSNQLGIASSWIQFKEENNANYEYKNENDHEHTTYPFGGYNEYYYAGLDCSGYMGWLVYNTLNNGKDYVTYASNTANLLANHGLGTLIDSSVRLQTGDIISMSGHVWMCLGVCDDESILLIHSTTGASSTNHIGGGVQLSVLSKNNTSHCDAYMIASDFMRKYAPEWIEDYPILVKNYEQYMINDRKATFRWYLDQRGLEDQENIIHMKPEEILNLMY